MIQWIRRLLGLDVEQQHSDFANEHYASFEVAVAASDVEVWIYEDNICTRHIVLKGNPFHSVTVGNLVQFYKLNRQQRRKMNARIVVGTKAWEDDSSNT